MIDYAANTQIAKIVDGKVKIDWDATLLINSKADDQVNFVFYNKSTDQALTFTNGIPLSATTSSI